MRFVDSDGAFSQLSSRNNDWLLFARGGKGGKKCAHSVDQVQKLFLFNDSIASGENPVAQSYVLSFLAVT